MAWSTKSRHQRGYGSRWDKLRAYVLSNEPLCRACASKTPPRVSAATSVDHIKSKAKGGTDDLANLQPVCDECRAEKDATDRGARLRPRFGVDGEPEGGW